MAGRLSLDAASGIRALVVVHGLPTAVASLLPSMGPRAYGLQQLWFAGPAASQHVRS